MKENKKLYEDVEKLSTENEKARWANMSQAEKDQVALYIFNLRIANLDWKKQLRNNVCTGK
jgi:hypothetical protein